MHTNSRNKLKMFLHLNGLMKIKHFRRLPSKYFPAEPKKYVMKSNSDDFETYEQLYSLLNRYIRYCYTWNNNKYKYKYYDWNVDKMTERFMKRFKTKYAIEQWFLECFNGHKKILEPTSYYDLELKLSIRGY